MITLQLAATCIAAVMLFLHSLQSFSREVRVLGRDKLRGWLTAATRNRFTGFALGAIATALVQSSSAVSALTVSFVNSGLFTFPGSLAVMLGANVGTTITAWLVSFKLTGLGAFAIILGTLLSAIPGHARVVAKSVFYFGLIFLSLDLISSALAPFRDDPWLIDLLADAQVPWVGVLAGLVATLAVQSSSVTTGLVILLVQQGVLVPQGAVAIVIGANIGTCATGLIASIPMDRFARRAASANLMFNVVGTILIFPFITPFATFIIGKFETPALAVAMAHLIFNLAITAVFLPFLGPLGRFLTPGNQQQMDFTRKV
jgi:phosphate:Na+ symporter